MGTWGVNAFDNDDAGDWINGLHRQPDLAYVEEALDRVLGKKERYLEAPDAQRAIAAAETVARQQGHWGQLNAEVRQMNG